MDKAFRGPGADHCAVVVKNTFLDVEDRCSTLGRRCRSCPPSISVAVSTNNGRNIPFDREKKAKADVDERLSKVRGMNADLEKCLVSTRNLSAICDELWSVLYTQA